MQNALINVSERDLGNGAVQTVNARDLHAFLEVGKDFSNWIKDRIEQYGFAENTDFVVFAETGENPKGGRRRNEYALTLDMAKELAMVERNEKGKQARQYFIECERKAKAAPVALTPANLSRIQLLELAMQAEQERMQLAQEVKALTGKAAAFDRISDVKGAISITAAAKVLDVQRRCDLFVWLNRHRWIYRRAGNPVWYSYQDKIQSGLMAQKVYDVTRSDGSTRLIEQALITPKGLAKLSEMLNEQQVAA